YERIHTLKILRRSLPVKPFMLNIFSDREHPLLVLKTPLDIGEINGVVTAALMIDDKYCFAGSTPELLVMSDVGAVFCCAAAMTSFLSPTFPGANVAAVGESFVPLVKKGSTGVIKLREVELVNLSPELGVGD